MVAEAKTWSLANAKAHLSEVVNRAIEDGPQTVTRHGREAVVVSAEEWRRRTERKGSLVEFFLNSPLPGSGLVIEREKGGFREADS